MWRQQRGNNVAQQSEHQQQISEREQQRQYYTKEQTMSQQRQYSQEEQHRHSEEHRMSARQHYERQEQTSFVQQMSSQRQIVEQCESYNRIEKQAQFKQQLSSQNRNQVQEMVMRQEQISYSPAITQQRNLANSPPVFEKVFRNARFAEGGDAHFEGKIKGSPKPVVSWTRKGAPMIDNQKYQMHYDKESGDVSLIIRNIGPGDEGEYTCTARNSYGEAICSVYIQSERQHLEKEDHFASQRVQQYQRENTNKQSYATNGYHRTEEKDFKVDTFEYRLLRELSFRDNITKRYIGEQDVSIMGSQANGPIKAPQVVQKPRSSKLNERTDAVFTTHISANPEPRVTWFKDGQRITQSQKHQTSFVNDQATLKIVDTNCADSGHYTLLAENAHGCVVASAFLAVESAITDDRYEREIYAKTTTQIESSKMKEETKRVPPNFTSVSEDRDVTEGKMTKFECRVTGHPHPDVAWFINGRHVTDDATHKILANESGRHSMVITCASRNDCGVVTCVARNDSGETSFQCNLNVIEKEQVVAPKFVERFSGVTVKEGEPVVLSARAVGTPVPRITWQKDGVHISPDPMVQVDTDGGASTLDISRARASDAGWYQCTAQNVAGSTATRARLVVKREAPSCDATDNVGYRPKFPKATTVIPQEPTVDSEVIYLKHVERAAPHRRRTEDDRTYPPPHFLVPLSDIDQPEGSRIHFEARVEPVGDSTMRVEWYHDGQPIPASSRVTTTFSYGFIALDMLSIIPQDAGHYTCRVYSSSGCVECTALLSVQERASIERTSQYPDSLPHISQLEEYSRYERSSSTEEAINQRPIFIRPLHDLGQLQEGRNAHFEAQLTPVSDSTMKVEWYKDGKTLTASSRITTIFNFGYVSLNIMHLRPEDSGTYTLKAFNSCGEAITQSTISVQTRTSVTGSLDIPEQQRYISQVEALEMYQQQQHTHKEVMEPLGSVAPPQFKTPIKPQKNVQEGGYAHFDARLEPLNDSTLQVEWLKDGRPVEASSRITTFFNFGYVALTLKHVTSYDAGTYTCRAYNQLGDASTSAQLSVISKEDIIFDTQHPKGLQRLRNLEEQNRYSSKMQEQVTVTQKPQFLGPLKGTNKIVEGQQAHFESRVEPQNDSNLKVDWYFNGKVIMSANRIQTHHDFGYVSLDILGVRADDAGTYTVVASNSLGEAQLSSTMQVETRSSIDTSSMHRSTYEKTNRMTETKFTEPRYEIEEISKTKPIFTQPLHDFQPIVEGKNVHMECKLEPMGDPTMRIEWFHNGRPITVGSRFRTYYDFGYVILDIIHVTAADAGEYTLKATNHLGSAHTSSSFHVISRSNVQTDSQHEAALEQIQLLEDSSRYMKQVSEDVSALQAPQFSRPLHNIETMEGTNVHLECRLKPIGDSTMKVEWFVNGHPAPTGHRFRPAYDFDYVALDLLGVYAEDSGVYTCHARNQLGEAVTSCSVRIIPKKDLILDTQHPNGLEKIQYLEDSSRYKKTEAIDEQVLIRPRFLTKPKSLENLKEGQYAHFECKLEPVTDSNLKVEWFKNGKPIIIGHRFRPIHDFGYVALDIIDLIAEDSGVYTCRAVNLAGQDETGCSLTCKSGAQILTETQNEVGLTQIQYLEERSRYHRTESSEELTKQAPIFTSSLKNCDIKEGQRAHFECRLIPVSDTTMKVEWFHNNMPIKSGSRFTETNAFGFVALDILQCLPEDSGVYTCRARNILGEAITSANLNVQDRRSIYMDTQHADALGRLHQLEERNRYQRSPAPEEVTTQAPVFTQPMMDLNVAESQAAHFEARLIPVGDDRLKVDWLRNGVPIEASNRITTMHDFGYVALNFKYVYPEDSGSYTCRAVNDLGQALTSAILIVQSKAALQLDTQHEGAMQKLRLLEDSARYKRKEEVEVTVNELPRFTVPLNGPSELMEGFSAHYECRIEPYPDSTLKVEWFHNDQPLQSGHRFRTTYDFGFASLDILTVYAEDSGTYTCRATNKLGQTVSAVNIQVKSKASIIRETQHRGALQKIQYLEDDSRYKKAARDETVVVEKPQFGRSLKNIEHLPEGKSAHLEATLIPVNDATMKVEWFCNGRPIPQGHRFKTTYDFGFVALDILYAYHEDSGTYMCKAKNLAGEAITTCIVSVDSKEGLLLDTLDEDRLKKIRDLEAYERPKREEIEPEQQRPVFLTPLNNLNIHEGERAHLECRVEPINDGNVKVEWFVNGVEIKTGHRFKTTHDFGYVALDILYAYSEDSGTYMCKATNLLGEAVNTCQINVSSRRNIYLDTQHPDGLKKIRELEAQGRPARLEIEEPEPTRPVLTELRGLTNLVQGQTAHIECQVSPIHDSNLRVEFYHNGKPLPSSSRFHSTYDFGYVSLDIGHVVPDDSGEYTVKAINKLGECATSIRINVQGESSILSDTQNPEGLEKIRQLEEHSAYQRRESMEQGTLQKPVFTQPIQNIDFIAEGQTAHFECRLIPLGDSTLKVEWYRNEKPCESSSRIAMTNDFGFVSMDISKVRAEDDGVYMCRAVNSLGEAVTTASMKVKTEADIQLESQHPDSMRKIQRLETKTIRHEEIEERQFDKPIFTQLLTGPSEILEGQLAHFECRVLPVGDSSLKFDWFINGKELKMGSRFVTNHDFGFVTLDISQTVAEDSGVYTCKATNDVGEAVSSAAINVRSRSGIAQDALHPDAWRKIQLKEAEMNRVPEMFIDTEPQQAPVFTTHLESKQNLVEGQHVNLQAQVEPRADANLRIEWFKNGQSLTTGSRIRSTFDFGLVSLAINGLREDDSAIYTCKAVNKFGEAVSTCALKIEDRHWLIGKAQHPDALPYIEALEEPKAEHPQYPEPVYESPTFISHLNNVGCAQGESIHFECRVEPSKDATLQIEWYANGKPLSSGSRFKTAYDFGFVTLDIDHVLPEDSGIYTCRAINSKGQATTTGSLRCTGDADIYFGTQHPQGEAGLERVREVEGVLSTKYQRAKSVTEPLFPKPEFTTPLGPELLISEGSPLRLETQVEPRNDPNLQIEWYLNGRALSHGSRFRMSNDFGFVTLDVTDIYERDQGVYSCKASNAAGEAYTATAIYCTTEEGLIQWTQHPKGEEGLQKIRNLEDYLKQQPCKPVEGEIAQPPKFTSQLKDLVNLSQGEIAHFEASLVPVGDQTMNIEWFVNDKAIEASHRIRTVHAFGMVVLEILGTVVEDTGTYKCVATNKWGSDQVTVRLQCIETVKGQKPQFTSHIQSLSGLKDGDSAHFECTLVPINDQNLVVEWFHNGKPLHHKNRIKMVSDFGFVVMDIAYVQSHDSGEYVCKASNQYGEDYTKATLSCVGKSGVYSDSLQPDSLARIRELETHAIQKSPSVAVISEAPKFTTQLVDVDKLKEGQSAHFEAHLTPVNDQNLVVEWYYNGEKLPHGHRYRTFHDFGLVILDILYCYEENSGVYECRATNKSGSDSTKAVLKCHSKANLVLDTQLPEGMESGLEKIQYIEDSMTKTKKTKIVEEKRQAPVFTVPLTNVDNLREGENVHFETRLTPTDDANLKVEWFWNGKPLKTGSRFRTFCDFGFVILEISPVYPEDSGEYTCRASNEYGQAVTSATMKVQGKRSIILESQLPKGMESTMDKLAELEGLGQPRPSEYAEEESGKPPEFVNTPPDLSLTENSLAHFECRLNPVNDPSMRVDWFHNGKPISAGSRIKTISDFGFVILEVAGVYLRDSGLYTCKATNRHGEASTSCKLQVRGRQGIVLDPQLPNEFRSGTESIQKLEESLYKREELLPEEEKPNPPRFTLQLKDALEVQESQGVHFECRVEPVHDPTLRIDWFFNGRPFATGSRVHMVNDFGYISMDMDYTYARDSGEYICRATNKWGTAVTKAKLVCKAKHDVILDSQLPGGMSGEKLKLLEQGPLPAAVSEDEQPHEPPVFLSQIRSATVEEAGTVHFETRVEPKNDSKLRIEWYRNGKLLPSGHRYKSVFDFGYISLDIMYFYSDDAGEYVCKAINDFGEAITKASVSCKKQPTIVLQNQVPKGMKASEALMQMEAAIKKYTSEIHLTIDDLYDAEKQQPPRFVTQIKDQDSLVEMQSTKFECQLAPVGDPNMKVEWFLNKKPLAHKNRLTPIYDFGYVAMNFTWIYPEDSGEYLCRATNLYGTDETTAIVKTSGKPGIVYESQLPQGMKSIEKIKEMEASWLISPEAQPEEEMKREAPVFASKPEPVVANEGDSARFCCRVTGFPRPRVMWFINGHTVVNGMRYKLTYDGMWHLDIPKTRQYDHGKVEVVARNSVGEARVETTLTVTSRQDDYRAVLKNSPRPWYDNELVQYQHERSEYELEKVFEERQTQGPQCVIEPNAFKPKVIKEPEPEWTKDVRKKKSEDYYAKINKLEEEQIVKETRIREASHQVAIPGEKITTKERTTTKKKSEGIEEKWDITEDTLQPWQKKNVLKSRETEKPFSTADLEPSESVVHGKEVHISKQKQKQRETQGNLEILRDVTSTEKMEVEHKGMTTERIVEGPVKPGQPPIFTKKIQPCRAYEQEQAKFEVEFDGEPLPTIKWYREDFLIKNSPDFQIHTFSTKSILIIKQVYMEDSAVFAAVAENPSGKAKCSANLVVEERPQSGRKGVVPPSFLTTVQGTIAKAGQVARFDVRVSATKPLDVYWLKNGKKITTDSDIRYKVLEEDNLYTLLIIETVPEDSGTYECVALNSAGEARCEAELLVQASAPSKGKPSTEKPSAGQQQAPTIVEPIKGQVMKEGQPVTFRCKISGKQPLNVKWFKGDTPIKPSKYFQMSCEGDVHTLRLSEVFPEDEGQYKCVVTGPGGYAEASAQLKVLAPDSGEKAPTLSTMKDVTVLEGHPAQFKTQMTGQPKPTVEWFRQGILIPNSPDFQMLLEGNVATLVINSTYVEDSGRFTCRATNTAGQVETTAVLTVKPTKK